MDFDSQTIAIIITACILLLGFFHITYDMYSQYSKCVFIKAFSDNLSKLIYKIENSKKHDAELISFMQDYESAHELVYSGRYYDPIYEIAEMFEKRKYNSFKVQSQFSEFSLNIIPVIAKFDKERLSIRNKQLLNPIIWFYKGIEWILWYLFGYFISRNNPQFDEDNKIWKAFVSVITFVSMIMTILCFFGLDYEGLVKLYKESGINTQ